MKSKGCPCNNCDITSYPSGWNEFVLNTDVNEKTFTDYYNSKNIKPSGLVYYLKYYYIDENTINDSLRDISYAIQNIKNILFLDTKVVILSKYNDSEWDNYKETPIIFQGYTTLGNLQEYLRNLDFKTSNDDCLILHNVINP